MRPEQRMVTKLAAASASRNTDPQHLIRIVGETLGAQWCELRIGNRRYEWSDPGPRFTERILCVLSSDPEVTIAIAPPSVSLTERQWQPLLILLEPLIFADAAERMQRLRNKALQRLDDARWRASVDMAEERRRLERDLHDGAQHHLVALQMSIALAEHHADEPGAQERLDTARAQLESVEQVLISTARGVLPRTLAEEGLNGALEALAGPALTVRSDLPRLMPAVESALYFVALEAVSNAKKHAPGAHVTIDAHMRGGRVTISIRDDGPGFVVDEDGVGGLSHLAYRLESIHGEVDVQSAEGEGTCVTAWVRY